MEAYETDLTHANYKVATDRLIEWLLNTACRQGINLPDEKFKCGPESGSRRHFKSIKDYGKLAAALATRTESGVRLPPTLAVVIRQAITLRELQSKKFPDTARYRARNIGHRHFTEELKFVFQLLEATTSDIDLGRLSSSTLCSSDIISAVWVQTRARHASTSPVSLGGELSGSEFDRTLAVCTFFEDMAAIRDDLHDTWRDYATGTLCLTAAAVTTDTAFTIMKSSCEEIVQLVPDAPTWLALTMRLKEVTDRQSLPGSDFLDLTCAKVAFTLNQLCQNLKPDHLLVKRPGQFQDYNAARDRSAWSIDDQDAEDAVILSELFVDVVALSRTKLSVPAQDKLTAGLRTTVDGGSFQSMPIYVVFAAQIFLDIHHLLREGVARPFDNLQAAGKRAYDILDEHFRHGSVQSGVNTPCNSTKAMEEIMMYAKEWTENDAVGTTLHQRGGGAASVRSCRLLRLHPILCGLKVFRLEMLLQHSGVEMCNDSGSVICAAHIYNAACRSGSLQKNWRDIDYVIDLHTPERVFSGSTPTVAVDYFDKFLLALTDTQRATYDRVRLDSGASCGRTNSKRVKLKTTSPVRDVFESRYVLGADTNMTLANVVAMSHVATKRSRSSALSKETVEFLGEMATKRRHTTTELLSIIREAVAAEELHLLFDYIGLHDRVMKFLGEMYETFGTNLDLPFSSAAAVLDTSNLALAAARIFDVARGLDQCSTESGRAASGNVFRNLSRTVLEFLEGGQDGAPGSASVGPAYVLTNASVVAHWDSLGLK